MDIKCTFQETEIDDILNLLDIHQGNSKIISGGTDLILQLQQGKTNPQVLIDISKLQDIKWIKEKENLLEIGAGVTFSKLIKNNIVFEKVPALIEAAKSVGSPQIRNTATLGGNICNGSPAADIVPPLLVLDSQLLILSKHEERKMHLEDFFLDKGKVNLKGNELLTYIQFESLKENQGLGFTKLGFRKALAISRLSVAVFVEIEDNLFKEMRIATGSCGKYPIRERKLEDFFKGKETSEENIEMGVKQYKEVISHRLIGRKGGEYKSVGIMEVFKKSVRKAICQAT